MFSRGSVEFTIGSYNILHPEFALKHKEAAGLDVNGQSNWAGRKIEIVKKLEESNLDIICLQEVSAQSIKDLMKSPNRGKLKGYSYKHIPNQRGDGVAILWKKSVFKEKHKDEFEVNNSVRSGFVDLMKNGKTIRVASCHLTGGKNQVQGEKDIHNIRERVESQAKNIDAIVIAGDFNATQDSGKIKKLEGYKFDGDTSPTEIKTSRKIDWVFVKSEGAMLSPLKLGSSAAEESKAHPSDHRLIATKVELKSNSKTQIKEKPLKSKSFFEGFILGPIKSFFNWFLKLFGQ